MVMCVYADCPVQKRYADGGLICGWLQAGTPCAHPSWRDEWRALLARLREREGEGAKGGG